MKRYKSVIFDFNGTLVFDTKIMTERGRLLHQNTEILLFQMKNSKKIFMEEQTELFSNILQIENFQRVMSKNSRKKKNLSTSSYAVKIKIFI